MSIVLVVGAGGAVWAGGGVEVVGTGIAVLGDNLLARVSGFAGLGSCCTCGWVADEIFLLVFEGDGELIVARVFLLDTEESAGFSSGLSSVGRVEASVSPIEVLERDSLVNFFFEATTFSTDFIPVLQD